MTTLDPCSSRLAEAGLAGGQASSVEECLQDTNLHDDPEILLDLVYNEIVLREELGEQPTAAEYIKPYPRLEEDLKLHFEVHAALRDKVLLETRACPKG